MVFRSLTPAPKHDIIWTGAFQYCGLAAQQNHNAVAVFTAFFAAHTDIDLVVEIGTGSGGFAMFLKDECDKIGAKFVTYENNPDRLAQHQHTEFVRRNIDVRQTSALGTDGKQSIVDALAASTRAAVLCDGGDKVSEFNVFAKYLRPGDLLLAHDYAPDNATFNNEYMNKIWNWHEIDDARTMAARESANLVPYYPDFNSAAWLCVIKAK